MYPGVLIPEFTMCEVLAPSCGAVLRRDRGHATAPACGCMQRLGICQYYKRALNGQNALRKGVQNICLQVSKVLCSDI